MADRPEKLGRPLIGKVNHKPGLPGRCAQCDRTSPDLAPVEPRYGWGIAQSYGNVQTWCAPCRKLLKGQWRWTPLERFMRKRRSWKSLNDRRVRLIHKEIKGQLTAAETDELKRLQDLADAKAEAALSRRRRNYWRALLHPKKAVAKK